MQAFRCLAYLDSLGRGVDLLQVLQKKLLLLLVSRCQAFTCRALFVQRQRLRTCQASLAAALGCLLNFLADCVLQLLLISKCLIWH